ncbi:hypothetical protein HanIR_Chr10g0500241 [Helianthus annuus]|nr:hypothetical protein HanIR_Chr10g0500241 [Helianthus annuus]
MSHPFVHNLGPLQKEAQQVNPVSTRLHMNGSSWIRLKIKKKDKTVRYTKKGIHDKGCLRFFQHAHKQDQHGALLYLIVLVNICNQI